jgi:uncharacterized protein (DUF885 family)
VPRLRAAPALIATLLLVPPRLPAPRPAADFGAFVDRYLDAFARRHPSIAAGNGIHDHDDLLEDFSAEAIAAEVADLKALRSELRGFDASRLTPDERVDQKILDGIIDGWLLEQETLRNWARNPMLYASAIADGVHNQMVMEYAPAPVRMRRVIAKLRHVPRLLASAKANVPNPPRLFAQRGVTMMRGASGMLAGDLRLAFADAGTPALRDSLARAADAAKVAIDAYAGWLEKEVLPKASGDFTIGAVALSRRYRAEELIDTPLDQMVRIGERELKAGQAAFRAAAAKVDPKRDAVDVWHDAWKDHPPFGQVIPSTQRIVDSLSSFVTARGLATVPAGERAIVAQQQPFDIGAASMHASPPLEAVPVKSFYYVNEPKSTGDAAQDEALLQRSNRFSVTITSSHEAMPGHWLHSVYMRKTPGKIRRIWIGLNPFPQPSSGQDGWAHYAEQLVVEQGYGGGDPRYVMAQQSDALMRICRLLSGIRVHTKQWTLEDAQGCFEKEAFLAPPAAKREAERSAYDPTYGGYFLGKRGFLKLRKDLQAKQGKGFDLKAFHEQVMGNGIAPIWAHRALLLPGDTSPLID